MNSQELRNLQEAYSQVYEGLDEGKSDRPLGVMHQFARGVKQKRGAKKDEYPKYLRMQQSKKRDKKETESDAYRERQRVQPSYGFREEVSVYDIILSHLLDEGYAETSKAAEAIMVNMSEEWREEIIDEANKAERELGLSSRAREQARNLNRNADKPIFYKNSQMGKSSDPIVNKAHKRMTAKRQASHKAGRHLRGDTGEKGNVVKSRYQANKDHTDGYPSITLRGYGPS
jgi:hypothetical protein